MAVVYKAYDTRLETDVAVKVIRTEKLNDETRDRTLKRFEREAKALARLTHPNIVKVTDYGEYEGKPYLVMPYLQAGTLKQRLGKFMSWQEALRLLIPIANALQYAHQLNIIHRDVKASNILITESGQPVISDFGVAKILTVEDTTDLTGTGLGIGTPEYMAPEQWIGTTSPKSDQYSLGVVLYEMLTGRKPYTAETPAAVLLKQATEPLPRPRQFAKNLPEKVERLLIKALARNPDDRYKDMGAFVAAMDAALAGGGIKPPNATLVSLRNNWLLWAGLLVGAIILLVGGLLTVKLRSSPVPASAPRPSHTKSVSSSIPSIPATKINAIPTCEAVGDLPNPDLSFTHLQSFDDFDNPVYDGTYNQSKWFFNSYNIAEATQSQGHFVISSSKSASDAGIDLIFQPDSTLSMRNSVSARLCSSLVRGSSFATLIKFVPRQLGYYWHYSCWITSLSIGDYFSCSAMKNDNIIYQTNSILIHSRRYYDIAIEVNPSTGAIKSYLDGKGVDVYLPDIAQELRTGEFSFSINTWVGSESSGVALVDDARVGVPILMP